MNSAGYGGASGQRGGYEAPACVQNAMMTKDKKPFTYTPGGIDLSQIKSERMAKRLARNAQAEGATGASQLNRPAQPQSPQSGGSPGTAAASIGAAAMGMPFQVLPPPPPPPGPGMSAGKKPNGTPAPPPPPPSSTLAPPTNGSAAPGSPNAARKSPTPQRFEPPPMGFRPEIKIPTNPMAALRKVPPPVEKNTFWKDEYVKERSKSPMVGENDRNSSPPNGTSYNNNNDTYVNDDGFKKSMPNQLANTTTQQPEMNYNHNQQQQQHQYSPQTAPQQLKMQYTPPAPSTPPQQQHPPSPRAEFRSVAAPQSPAVSVYTRQTDSPRADTATPPQRATESPFRYGGQQSPQHQQQQQRIPPAVSPLAQQHPQQTFTPPPSQPSSITTIVTPSTPMATQPPAAQSQSQSVPWRTQRAQPQASQPQQMQPQQQQQQQQTHSQPIYNNVQQQGQQQRTRDVSDFAAQPPYGAQTQPYQGPKPTSVGSLYIAPLAPPTEPQAQNIIRQQMMQQQQQQRDSPMRQMPQQQPQQQQQQQQQQSAQAQTARQPARWMHSQPAPKEQPEWARPEENGNVVPSSLHHMKSPPPPSQQQQQQQQNFQSQQQPQQYQQYQPTQGNGFASPPPQNFGSHINAPTGLRLQINTTSVSNSSGPKERIIPITLEQTPTYTPSQPSFNAAPAGYVIRSPNQFVDQGYNNYAAQSAQLQQQQREPSVQRVMSPTQQQLNAPRMIQQQQQQQQQIQQQNVSGGGTSKTRIIPIALESEGTRGPISQAPIVLQNDPRSPPVQSKSFRILQKITDTADDGSSDSSIKKDTTAYIETEPQLQRPHFARQMSAQEARHSPTVEQMRRMQIAQQQQSQQQAWNQDQPQPYVHPSEQHVPEPKKYTGSAIPSRSFKRLQAMTTPENAGPGQSDL